jgi:hypothetical protein
MLKVVSHTPAEIEAMERLKASLGFIDLVREAVPEPEKLFSWWSYRAQDFRQSNRGLRLDHLWVSPTDGSTRATPGVSRTAENQRKGLVGSLNRPFRTSIPSSQADIDDTRNGRPSTQSSSMAAAAMSERAPSLNSQTIACVSRSSRALTTPRRPKAPATAQSGRRPAQPSQCP